MSNYKGKRIHHSFWGNVFRIVVCIWIAIILIVILSYEPILNDEPVFDEKIENYGSLPGDNIPATSTFKPDPNDVASVPWEVGPTNWVEHKANLVCSAYTASVEECGKSDGITYSGAKVKTDHTIAVDHYNPYFKIGTQVLINGITYTVEDTGDLNKYGRDLDIYFDSYDAAKAFGVQTLEVIWYEGN